MKLVVLHDHSLDTGALDFALRPDGGVAYAACCDGAIYSVEIATGKASALERRHQSFASGCVLLPDNRTLISGGYDGALLWHDTDTGRCWRRVSVHDFWSWRLALSPEGTRIASVTGQYLPGGWKYEPAPSEDPSVVVLDTRTGDRVASFQQTPPVLSVAFSPDGRHLAAANMMGEIRIWDLQAGGGSEPAAAWTSPAFTSWGTIKSHHYSGGIYDLAFAPDGETILACGMGEMRDPMAGNGKMTWQRWDWRTQSRVAEIREGQHGSGLMETLCWHPKGDCFVMAGRQAQGTWNAAVFSADGELKGSVDTRNRITRARFSSDGETLFVSAALGQPPRKNGVWPAWGRLQAYRMETVQPV